MPEGDTILRTAATLDRWLAGRRVTGARTTFASVAAGRLVGDTVETVTARGKHLLITFASGRVLHTHMRMTGSWHVYSAGERWKRPGHEARFVLETSDRVAVCFNAPVVELLAARMEQVHPALTSLGPDILVAPLDVGLVVRLAATRLPETEIGDLLLDQRVVAGIGNIYRCETLFLCKVNPRARSDTVDLAPMIRVAAKLLRAGVDGTRGPNWVYGRGGRPCRRCGGRISAQRVGHQARTAYWCAACQPLD